MVTFFPNADFSGGQNNEFEIVFFLSYFFLSEVRPFQPGVSSFLRLINDKECSVSLRLLISHVSTLAAPL